MKRWSALALVLMLMVTLASTAEAGKWRRWGRSSGFGWSDGYHAPSRYSHVGYHGATFWDGGFDQPAMETVPEGNWLDQKPIPSPMFRKSGEPDPMATQPLWRGWFTGY